VIVPTTTGAGDSAKTTWQYKYVKSFEYNDGKINSWVVTDDINQAYAFVVETQPPGSNVLTAIQWIEKFFLDTREGYNRANFAVISYSSPAGNETKKVATSETVLVDKSKYIDGRFSVKSLGTGENRDVFLCHTKTPGLPSRFHVKETCDMTLETNQLFNIRSYERSIRKIKPPTGEEFTYADAANLVYLADSPGFSTMSPWLTETQI
jgi:hypothetical protein